MVTKNAEICKALYDQMYEIERELACDQTKTWVTYVFVFLD